MIVGVAPVYGGDFPWQGSRVSEANDNSPSKKGLSSLVFPELDDGAACPPYVSAEDSLPEFTFKTVFVGILFGIASVAFVQNQKPEGIGADWLGPHWLSDFAGLVAFGILIGCFIKLVRR